MGRSRGGLTTEIHARRRERPPALDLLISPGQVHDILCAESLVGGLENCTVVIADKGYNAEKFRWKKTLYRQPNHVERYFNKLKPLPPYPLRHQHSAIGRRAVAKTSVVRIKGAARLPMEHQP